MQMGALEDLTRVFQASITPVALVSGVGLLILSQTNRFSRITDRLRELISQRSTPQKGAHHGLNSQIAIFHRRARIMRLAIAAAVGCVLFCIVMVLVLFSIAVLDLRLHLLVLLLFAISLVCLIVSLVLFLLDMQLALSAVEEELKERPEGG